MKCSSEITIPGKITGTCADGASQFRLAVSTTSTKNTQVGLTAINVTLK